KSRGLRSTSVENTTRTEGRSPIPALRVNPVQRPRPQPRMRSDLVTSHSGKRTRSISIPGVLSEVAGLRLSVLNRTLSCSIGTSAKDTFVPRLVRSVPDVGVLAAVPLDVEPTALRALAHRQLHPPCMVGEDVVNQALVANVGRVLLAEKP